MKSGLDPEQFGGQKKHCPQNNQLIFFDHNRLPKDCGGVWGYEDMLEAMKDPKHEGHESALEWLGEDFDPEAFDLEATNKDLSQV